MNRKQQSVILAGLLAVSLALSGCKGMRSSDEAGQTGGSTLGSSTSSGQAGYGAGSKSEMGASMGTSGSSGTGGAMGSGTASTMGAQTQEGAMSMPNSTVLAIEPMPKSAAMGAVGSSGAAGTTGSSGEAYRITLRMDDGSTQVVTQDTIPEFRSGDRVRVESGMIRR